MIYLTLSDRLDNWMHRPTFPGTVVGHHLLQEESLASIPLTLGSETRHHSCNKFDAKTMPYFTDKPSRIPKDGYACTIY